MVEVKSWSPVKTGPIKVRVFAKAFLKFVNMIKEVEASASSGPRATVKERCPVCKNIFSKSGLEGHIEAKHWISCSKCDKRFPVDQLEAHMNKDHELLRVPCDSCGKVVFSQVSLMIALLIFLLSFEQASTPIAGSQSTHGHLPRQRVRDLQPENCRRRLHDTFKRLP